MNTVFEVIKFISLLTFYFFSKYKFNAAAMSSVFIGIGTGVVANVMFVLTTTTNYHFANLIFSLILGIILLAIGSLEKKDK